LIQVRQRFSIAELLLIGFVAAYPLLINPFAAPVFGLPKVTFLKLVAIAIAGLWVVSAINKGSFRLDRSDLTLPLITFFSIALLSSLQSIHPLTSLNGQYGRWEGMMTIVCYFVIYLAASSAAKNTSVFKPLFIAMLSSAALVSIAAIIEPFWTNPFLLFAKIYCAVGFGEPNTFETGRSLATFGNPTFLAAYLAFVLPIALSCLFANRRDIAPGYLLYPASLLITIALLLTFGRGAWIGAVAGIFLVGALNRHRLKQLSGYLVAVTAVFVLSLVIVQFAGTTYSVTDRVASIFKVEGSTLTRVQMWGASLPLISENPLLGSGPDTFKYVFGKYKPEGWVERLSDPPVDKAHSDSLQVAVTSGVLGLVAYLWIFIAFLWSGIKKVALLKERREAWLAIGILGAVFAYAIQLQFNFSHFTTAPFFWLFMGLANGYLFSDNPGKTINIKTLARQRVPVFSALIIAVMSLVIISITPLIADMHFAKGRELQSINKSYEAVKKYDSAVLFNGREPTYRTSLAEMLIGLGTDSGNDDYINLGSKAFIEAKRLNPLDEQIYFRAGAAFLEAGRNGKPALLKESIKYHYHGLTLNPVMVDAYIDIGVAYAYLNDYDEAIGAWSDALLIRPDDDRAYFNLGWAYEQKGQSVRAKEAYLKAYQLNPGMIEAKAAYDRL